MLKAIGGIISSTVKSLSWARWRTGTSTRVWLPRKRLKSYLGVAGTNTIF